MLQCSVDILFLPFPYRDFRVVHYVAQTKHYPGFRIMPGILTKSIPGGKSNMPTRGEPVRIIILCSPLIARETDQVLYNIDSQCISLYKYIPMENLLTIKDAAQFLNVSEMSLRRWTNAGKLKCYRVGGKKERRFTRQELEHFLQTQEGRVPLGICGAAVEDSSHIAHFYRDAAESVAAGIEFSACGLSRSESILIVSTETKLSQILAGLELLGFPVEKLKSEGTIVTDTGRCVFNEQVHFLAAAMADFPIKKGSRLLGDMVWAVEKGWTMDEICRLESKANHLLHGSNKLILCQYDLTYFGADMAMKAFDAHTLTLYRGEIQQSPYFRGSTGEKP